MSREIVAEIVRRALEPQPAAIGEAVPGESPIEERLRLLRESLEMTRQRLSSQDMELARLREQISGYTSFVDESRRRMRNVEAQAWALRQPAPGPAVHVPAPVPAPVAPPNAACAPRPVPTPVTVAQAPRSGIRWLPSPSSTLVAASIVAAFFATHGRAPRPRLRIADVPPPLLQAIPEPEGSVSTIADDVGNADILALVYAYVPPGSARAIRDTLGPQIESASGSPWIFAKVDDKTTLVSFRPRGDDAAAYEFVVDPASKLVSPSPETLRNLAGITVAAAR